MDPVQRSAGNTWSFRRADVWGSTTIAWAPSLAHPVLFSSQVRAGLHWVTGGDESGDKCYASCIIIIIIVRPVWQWVNNGLASHFHERFHKRAKQQHECSNLFPCQIWWCSGLVGASWCSTDGPLAHWCLVPGLGVQPSRRHPLWDCQECVFPCGDCRHGWATWACLKLHFWCDFVLCQSHAAYFVPNLMRAASVPVFFFSTTF